MFKFFKTAFQVPVDKKTPVKELSEEIKTMLERVGLGHIKRGHPKTNNEVTAMVINKLLDRIEELEKKIAKEM